MISMKGPSMKRLLLAAAAAALLVGAARAQPTAPPAAPAPPPSAGNAEVRTYGSATAPFASTITVPAGYDTIYVAGRTAAPTTAAVPATATTPAVPAVYGNTEQQTEAALMRIEADLRDQGVGLADIVQMHVFLVGDPAQGGHMDFAGMMAGYLRHFGAPNQPNRPVRTTVQVAALAGPGQLVEIDVIAVRPPQARARPAS
jgi:enamine deaminase RidA (YjgF/YER057c/UK114 family)